MPEVVGIYINGEFIDGERLERLKKLERVVENNDNKLTQ
jgi:hypothetical protein